VSRASRLLALAAVFVIVSGGECSIGDLGSLLDAPGRISVTNIGTEPAVIAILADDVKSYPTLAGGATASVQTNTGGRYEVRVVMTPENAATYRADLASLRTLVEKQISDATDPAEKTRLFLDLAGIKAAIQALSNSNAAGCSGTITLDAEETAEVAATVNWVTSSGAGFWDVTCGSN
jgi:hypothetical protein